MKKILLIIALCLSANLAQAEETAQPTAAAVADKALDLAKAAVVNVSDVVKKTAPEVWRIMVKQQCADAVSSLCLVAFFFFIGGLYTITINKVWKLDEHYSRYEEENHFIYCKIIPIVYFVLVSVIGSHVAALSIQQIINPEYYAIKDMLAIALNK
jgi:hypothetical protein